jgi:hypothetical protein
MEFLGTGEPGQRQSPRRMLNIRTILITQTLNNGLYLESDKH